MMTEMSTWLAYQSKAVRCQGWRVNQDTKWVVSSTGAFCHVIFSRQRWRKSYYIHLLLHFTSSEAKKVLIEEFECNDRFFCVLSKTSLFLVQANILVII